MRQPNAGLLDAGLPFVTARSPRLLSRRVGTPLRRLRQPFALLSLTCPADHPERAPRTGVPTRRKRLGATGDAPIMHRLLGQPTGRLGDRRMTAPPPSRIPPGGGFRSGAAVWRPCPALRFPYAASMIPLRASIAFQQAQMNPPTSRNHPLMVPRRETADAGYSFRSLPFSAP